jgi:uncharacterized delta-60 repeat protein
MNRTKISLAFLFTIFLTLNIFAQDIDTSFVSKLEQTLPAGSTVNITIQPDGKIVYFGVYSLTTNSTVGRSFIVRANLDGSPDTSFNYTPIEFNISSIVVRQDGKLLVGLDSGFNSTPLIILLNADGSRDTSFNTNFASCGSIQCGTRVYAAQSDGSFYATRILVGSGIGQFYLHRFFSNGSLDSSFQSLVFDTRLGRDFIGKLEILPDGKLLICGLNSTNGVLFRLNLDGTKDLSFESPTVLYTVTSPFVSFISTFIIKNDGKIIVSGRFNSINGVNHKGFSRLNNNGSVDLAFVTDFSVLDPIGNDSQKLSDGRYIIWFTSVGFPGINNFVRFNANDTVDNTFSTQFGGVFLRDSQNRVTTPGFRLNIDGTLDTTYVPLTIKVNGNVSAIARQTDNKIIVCGNFDFASSTSRSKITRLNIDGTIDQSFDSGTGFDVAPNRIEVQTDGKILVAGDFNNYRGTPSSFLIRLNSTGTIDTTFSTSLTNSVYSIVPLSNGKILIGGIFSAFNGVSRPGVARLNSDGSLDSSFNASMNNAFIQSVLLQPDGKIMVGGLFTGIGGFPRSNLARINSDGTLDSSFNAGTISDVIHLSLSNGKYVVNLSDSVKRLTSEGSIDGSFLSPSVFGVKSMYVQSDGAVILGGSSFTVNGILRRGLIRLKNDGTFSPSFLADSANGNVNKLLGLPDGKVYVGGDFTRIGNTPRIGLARLNVIQDTTLRTFRIFDFDGDGKTDISVFRPSVGEWYYQRSSNSVVNGATFGNSTDKPVPADYTGDGKTDIAIYRPSSGQWFVLRSEDFSLYAFPFGISTDIPTPGDFDGDGKADAAVFRPLTGIWYVAKSSGGVTIQPFGTNGDRPVVADYDGDGKSDIAIFRPSVGEWYALKSAGGITGAAFGSASDKTVQGDYTGDGKADFAFYRPSTGNWFVLRSEDFSFYASPFGAATDTPTSGDYDGDGKFDQAVFRPSTGIWYINKSNGSGVTIQPFGASTDTPAPSYYLP